MRKVSLFSASITYRTNIFFSKDLLSISRYFKPVAEGICCEFIR